MATIKITLHSAYKQCFGRAFSTTESQGRATLTPLSRNIQPYQLLQSKAFLKEEHKRQLGSRYTQFLRHKSVETNLQNVPTKLLASLVKQDKAKRFSIHREREREREPSFCSRAIRISMKETLFWQSKKNFLVYDVVVKSYFLFVYF